jgi:D-ribose pyranose/furanose isomerase RbsD
MRRALPLLLSALTLVFAASCRSQKSPAAVASDPEAAENQSAAPSWEDIFYDELPALGHRNWIVVADSAFPLQISPGMEVVVANEDHFVVLERVLKAISESGHVRPKIYLDRELAYVSEALAPGMDACRKKIETILAKYEVKPVLHEELISRMDQVAKTFKILMIKTNLALPYTTVFMELDCVYWSPENEAKMREAMKK